MAYFEKREKADQPGEFEYVEVEPSKVELPEDELNKRVVAHPKYRDVLDESKVRKDKIRKLNADLKALEGEPETPVTPDPAQGQQSPAEAPKPLDEDTLYAKFRERLVKDQQAEQLAKTDEEKLLAGIAAKYGLNSDAIPLLATAKDPVKAAQLLEKSNYRFDDTTGGEPSAPNKDELIANVLDRLGLSDQK